MFERENRTNLRKPNQKRALSKLLPPTLLAPQTKLEATRKHQVDFVFDGAGKVGCHGVEA